MKNINKLKYKKGFTIIELIVSLAITSIILFISTETVVRLIRTADKADLSAEVDRTSHYLTDTLKKNIGQVSVSSGLQVQTCDYPNHSLAYCFGPSNTNKLDCSSTCTGSFFLANNKIFYFDSNAHSIYQCVYSIPSSGVNPIPIVPPSSCVNITGSNVLVSNFLITKSSNFVQIIIKLYDSNGIIYKDSPGNTFDIVTGVSTKFF